MAVLRAERVANGEFEAFRREWRRLPATPSEWHRNPNTGYEYDATAAWWTISHLDPEAGDIKDVWEPARFSWVYDLVRAFLLTGEDRYAAAFHTHFKIWWESNAPFSGVHWSCGQEVAIRTTALLYAEAAFENAPSSSEAAMDRIRATLSASGERIADAIGYAISQRNNHAISEAAGLVALGARLHGVHPEAKRWLNRGSRLLKRLVAEQFAEDGWYIQHSFTYLRLALDQCVIAERALNALGRSLGQDAKTRIAAATNLLVALIDSRTGRVPNYGANDGAFAHPITSASYRDFRPVLTAICAMFGAPFPEGVQLDREVLAWLRRPPPKAGLGPASGVTVGDSGWAVARVGETHVFLRAGSYRSRPSHVDPLQLCVRFGDNEVVVDPGTFSYNGPGIWKNALVAGRFHNGPLIDDLEPAVRGPRFVWFSWPHAHMRSAERNDEHVILDAERRGVRRTVVVQEDMVIVKDRSTAGGKGRYMVVRWLLHPMRNATAVSSIPAGDLLDASEKSPLGWYSEYYGERVASIVFQVKQDLEEGSEIVTTIRKGDAR